MKYLFIMPIVLLCTHLSGQSDSTFLSPHYIEIDGKYYRSDTDRGLTTQQVETKVFTEVLGIVPGLLNLITGMKPDKNDKVKNLERLLDLYAKSNKRLSKGEITQEQWQSIQLKANNFKQ